MVYVEGNCVINSYQDQDGNNRTSMSVYQSMFSSAKRYVPIRLAQALTNPPADLEVIRRPAQVEGEQ